VNFEHLSPEATEEKTVEKEGSNKRKQLKEPEKDIKKRKLEDGVESGNQSIECLLKKDNSYDIVKNNIFMQQGWKEHLCKCNDCIVLYSELNASFLLNDPLDFEDEDEVEEPHDPPKSVSLYEAGQMAFLSTFNQTTKIDVMIKYQEMQNSLKEYLKSFAETGKVVTAEDIQKFYQTLGKKK